MVGSHVVARGSCIGLVVAGIALAVACDPGGSCPGHPCDPTTDGTPYDLINWCQTSGNCLRDGMPVAECPHPDASPLPACALAPVSTNETLGFPVGQIATDLGGRRDLVIVYDQCERDGAPPVLSDLQVLYDGVPAACEAANPCDPSATPTVLTCANVPRTVELVTISFSYADAMGPTTLHVEMQNTTCSYFCS